MRNTRCRRCGHPIKADQSKKDGYGPVCHNKALKENKLQRGVFDGQTTTTNPDTEGQPEHQEDGAGDDAKTGADIQAP